MADFDNGLPPANSDMGNAAVSALTITKSPAAKNSQPVISAITISKANAVTQTPYAVSAVLIHQKDANGNWGMLL